ncbi:MAG: cupin domain-containing protein [Haloarculaceae archaeon]
MERTTLSEVENEPHPMGINSVRKPLSSVLGAADVAINYFELAPGEKFSGGLHTHHDQEEIFYVQSGTATFEVGTDRDHVSVGPGAAVRFAPGEFQHGYNPEDADEPVVGLAIGAPGGRHDWDQIESISHCPDCEAETSWRVEPTDDGLATVCESCGLRWESG